jgi:NADH-quinone oxidoreductase subunit N
MAILSTLFPAMLPEIILVGLVGFIIVYDIILGGRQRCFLGRVALAGLVVMFFATLIWVPRPETAYGLFGHMLRIDTVTWMLKLVLIAGATLTVLFSLVNSDICQNEEYFILLLTSTLGMMLMISSSDLIMLYLSIETTSIPLFILAGFVVEDQKSVEAGIKYLVYGAVTSAVMLYGFSLLYGFSGTTQIDLISQALQQNGTPVAAIALTLVLVLVGFGFKISAVPFQFWAPDVYEGAPVPVAGFLSTASKLAGFVVLMRVGYSVFSPQVAAWVPVIAGLSVGSMIVGNLMALPQKNIKRLLAYSSIAQAGYMLIGVASGSVNGVSATLYYLVTYMLTNLAAFGVVMLVNQAVGSSEISAFAGLSRRSPLLALLMLISLLSLAGIPPFGGFVGKLLVFAAAMQEGMAWLVFIAVVNTILALYYYLSILKVVFLYHSEEEEKTFPLNGFGLVALMICAAGIIILGVWIAPMYAISYQMSLNLLHLP